MATSFTVEINVCPVLKALAERYEYFQDMIDTGTYNLRSMALIDRLTAERAFAQLYPDKMNLAAIRMGLPAVGHYSGTLLDHAGDPSLFLDLISFEDDGEVSSEHQWVTDALKNTDDYDLLKTSPHIVYQETVFANALRTGTTWYVRRFWDMADTQAQVLWLDKAVRYLYRDMFNFLWEKIPASEDIGCIRVAFEDREWYLARLNEKWPAHQTSHPLINLKSMLQRGAIDELKEFVAPRGSPYEYEMKLVKDALSCAHTCIAVPVQLLHRIFGQLNIDFISTMRKHLKLKRYFMPHWSEVRPTWKMIPSNLEISPAALLWYSDIGLTIEMLWERVLEVQSMNPGHLYWPLQAALMEVTPMEQMSTLFADHVVQYSVVDTYASRKVFDQSTEFSITVIMEMRAALDDCVMPQVWISVMNTNNGRAMWLLHALKCPLTPDVHQYQLARVDSRDWSYTRRTSCLLNQLKLLGEASDASIDAEWAWREKNCRRYTHDDFERADYETQQHDKQCQWEEEEEYVYDEERERAERESERAYERECAAECERAENTRLMRYTLADERRRVAKSRKRVGGEEEVIPEQEQEFEDEAEQLREDLAEHEALQYEREMAELDEAIEMNKHQLHHDYFAEHEFEERERDESERECAMDQREAEQ